MKKDELISLYVKTSPTGKPIASEVSDYDEMFCLYKEIRITSRVKELLEKLHDGHRVPYKSLSAEEKHQIGLCYWYGCIVPLNFKKAIKYYRASAVEKYASAEWCLFVCYRDGTVVHVNKAIAKEWLKKAARHGNSKAQLTIARYYYEGELFHRNRKSAKRWFVRASENAFIAGDSEVLFCLGHQYFQGSYGMTVNIKKAIKHLEAAAERNDVLSIWLLTQVYSSLSDMEKVNYWKEELKRCPCPVPAFLQYK